MVRVANSSSLALPNDICCSKTLSGFTGILSDEILFESYNLVKPVNAQNWAIPTDYFAIFQHVKQRLP
jgi:hypothetical protein